MGMEWEATEEGFHEYVKEHFPSASIETDNEGQFIIYTNLKQDDVGRLVEMEG